MRKVLRDKEPRPLLAVCTSVLLPVWGNATHEGGWTHGTHGGVRSSLTEGLPCSQALTGGVYISFKTRNSSSAAPVHPYLGCIDIMQVILELHVTHLTLQYSKDEQQDHDRLHLCRWKRNSHRRGSHMGRSLPMRGSAGKMLHRRQRTSVASSIARATIACRSGWRGQTRPTR